MGPSAHVLDQLSSGPRLRDDETAERHIPFTRFLDRGVIATRNGEVALVFELDGVPHALADPATLETARGTLVRALRGIGDGYTMVYTHAIRIRRDGKDLLEPIETAGFEVEVDARYRAQLARNTLYELRHFITLLRRPVEERASVLANAVGSLKGFWSARSYRRADAVGDVLEARRRAIEHLEASATVLVSELSRFRIRRLTGTPEDRHLALRYFSMLASGVWQDAPASMDFLSHIIPTGRVTFGGEMFRVTGVSPKDDRVGAILAIQAYDDVSFTGMFDDLLSEKREYIVTQSFLPLDRLDSRNAASDQARRMRDSGDDAISTRAALIEAVDEIAKGAIVLGRHHFTIAVFTESETALVEAIADVNTALGASGLKMRREDMGLEAAFWAQLPGNLGYQTRSRHRLISNENFADFCAFHTHPQGGETPLPWGAPITAFPTYSSTAYHFSFHASGEHSNGNTVIFGPPGTGKTLIAGFLIAQSRRLPRPPRVIYFDKDRGAEAMIRSLGGDYIRLGPENGSGFNPFAEVCDEAGAEWLAGFIERIIDAPLTPEQTRRIAEATTRNAQTEDAGLKTFANFVTLLRSVDGGGALSLLDHLEDWTAEGPRAWLFDNPTDTFNISEAALGIDMTALLKTPRTRSAALDYLFYRLERLLEDGAPTIVFLDEGWKLLSDDRFAERIRDWMKTMRKLNGILCFATQEPSDAAKSPISETLIQSAETLMFFANPRADRESYVDAFHLSEIEYETVRQMPPERRAILIKKSTGSVLVDARIEDEATRKVFSGTTESVKHMELMRAEYGLDWLREFIQWEIPT